MTSAPGMTGWAEANERGSRGENEYHPEEFGLTATGIGETFGAYPIEFAMSTEIHEY